MNNTKKVLFTNLRIIVIYALLATILAFIDQTGYAKTVTLLFLPILLIISNLFIGIFLWIYGKKEIAKIYLLIGAIPLVSCATFFLWALFYHFVS